MRSVLRLQNQVLSNDESVTGMIGHINFDAKIIGKRNTGNPYVAFDEAGDGNVDQQSGAPLLDPTIFYSKTRGKKRNEFCNQKSGQNSSVQWN